VRRTLAERRRLTRAAPPRDEAVMSARDDATTRRVAAAIDAEEARSFEVATQVRAVALIVFAGWILLENPLAEARFPLVFVALLVALGIAQHELRRRAVLTLRLRYLFALFDAIVVAIVVIAPNPLDDTPHPMPQRYHWGNEIYLCALIAFSVFSYQPRLVLWHGVAAALAWTAATLLVLTSPGAYTASAHEWARLAPLDRIRISADPYFVYLGAWGRGVVIMLVTSATLAAFVHRARQLVAREAGAERARANLARYFSANLVDALSATDEPLRTTRSHECAVLFADVVGFSTLAERQAPAAVIAFLRNFHARMERAVFTYGGTLDKYIGDGVMATFGTPERGPEDAANALRCAHAMIASVAEWNAARAPAGEPPVAIGIGVHVGPVVLGDIGGPQRFEFAVVGDTVNVASRLERLSRTLGARIVASEALVEAIRNEGVPAAGLLEGFRAAPEQRLRGRDADVPVWYLPA
jgi:adenylate cyclase